jgi:murein L,D-transpeptidase YcbB/YkuD
VAAQYFVVGNQLLNLTSKNHKRCSAFTAVLATFLSVFCSNVLVAEPHISFKVALIQGLSNDKKASAHYEESGYQPIWTGESKESVLRRSALIQALKNIDVHALPKGQYNLNGLLLMFERVKTQADLGALEAKLTQSFLLYATQVHSGLVKPDKIDEAIAHKIEYVPIRAYLEGLSIGNPVEFIKSLPPQSQEYHHLLRARQDLLKIQQNGGWGPLVPLGKYRFGDTGLNIIRLRDRLITKSYLKRSMSVEFDEALLSAVTQFQEDHGLASDGVAGESTISEINISILERLKAVTVAMERERWQNKKDLLSGDIVTRKILVNLTDFTAKIIDNGIVTFQTRSVVGADEDDRRSPEFSDVMEHMVINPTWYVPRSITVKEYLPELQIDPAAHSYLTLFAPDGTTIPRQDVDFTLFDEETFPFEMKQTPSATNALGLVKFMFPNRHNIYLHDTPQKMLFLKEQRTFSHGCIRLQQPFEFAYALLALQSEDPVMEFQSILETGEETIIPLTEPVPVHIIYRTAVSVAGGRMGYRRDIYGRDALIFAALSEAGVVIRQNQG